MELELRLEAIAHAAVMFMQAVADSNAHKTEQALSELRSLGLRAEHIERILECLDGVRALHAEAWIRDDLIADGAASLQ